MNKTSYVDFTNYACYQQILHVQKITHPDLPRHVWACVGMCWRDDVPREVSPNTITSHEGVH